jgi:hypothetical protein
MKIKVDFKGEEVYENNTCLDVWMYMNVQAGYTRKQGRKIRK